MDAVEVEIDASDFEVAPPLDEGLSVRPPALVRVNTLLLGIRACGCEVGQGRFRGRSDQIRSWS
ncbi:MAG: hypothetical protein QOC85_848 [Streptomyces sp.]|jgi:hypothetical protein|nr:hypothetical protein [Streptomyces sp.]